MKCEIQQKKINHNQIKILVLVDNSIVQFKDLTKLLQDSNFVEEFTKKLLVGFDFYFETNGITSPKSPVVIILSRIKMNRRSNPKPFREHFRQPGSVVTFPNLANDAYLVVPKPIDHKVNYLNIRTFLETGSKEQIKEFWSRVGIIATEYLKYQPIIYLKTHGFGVFWLHFRVQSNRKYYHTKESDYGIANLK